jgi:hypothetical protein
MWEFYFKEGCMDIKTILSIRSMLNYDLYGKEPYKRKYFLRSLEENPFLTIHIPKDHHLIDFIAIKWVNKIVKLNTPIEITHCEVEVSNPTLLLASFIYENFFSKEYRLEKNEKKENAYQIHWGYRYEKDEDKVLDIEEDEEYFILKFSLKRDKMYEVYEKFIALVEDYYNSKIK